MTTYSHSKISTFNQCKYKYKLQYIDKIKPEVPTTIEAFMGDLVHQALEKLYKDLKYEKLNTKEELIEFYNQLWEKEYTDDIIIVKDYTAENYKKMGESYISMYYEHYKPFNQLTILGLETQDMMDLEDGNKYHVRIDKLACKDNIYYVCDYKTNAYMKDQEQADEDRQLAMYSIWIKDKFKDAKKTVLLWHMLTFDKEVTSERTEEQLNKLKAEIINNIKEIEACQKWPTTVTSLCDYCTFKSMCPSFKHNIEIENKSVEEFKDDDGVRLVNEYAKLDQDLKTTEKQKEEVKQQIIEFAKQKEIDVVYGSNKKTSVKPYNKLILPEDKEGFIKLIKAKGLYEELTLLNYAKLNSLASKKELDKDLVEQTTTEVNYRINLSKRNNIEDE